MAIEIYMFIVTQQPTDLLKWVILEKFKGRFYTPKKLKKNGLILGDGTTNKKKKLRSFVIFDYWVKSGSNNLLVTYEAFNNKGGYSLAFCERAHKCKDCESKNNGQTECRSKKKKKS